MVIKFDLVFLESVSTKKAPVNSWESLSRSVIIDLGNPRNPGSWDLWVSKYSIPGYCGETAEMLWSWARLKPLGEG